MKGRHLYRSLYAGLLVLLAACASGAGGMQESGRMATLDLPTLEEAVAEMARAALD